MLRGCLLYSVFELVLVFVAVEVAARFHNKTIVAKRPFLVATETHRFSGTFGSRIRTDERPTVNDLFRPDFEVIHSQLQIRERCHESLGHVGDSLPAV